MPFEQQPKEKLPEVTPSQQDFFSRMPDVFFDFLGRGSLCTIVIRERVVGVSHKRMGGVAPATKLNMFEVPRLKCTKGGFCLLKVKWLWNQNDYS